MRRNRLIIMLKEPVAGRVKTRLGADIGMTNAARWFRHQTSDLIRRMSVDNRWETILAIAPDTAIATRAITGNCRRMPQGSGDLGARMRRLSQNAPPGPSIIIGGDIPHITPKIIASAFQLLGSNDLVFGPAYDGGFWLVGAKHGAKPLPRNLFKNVRWSTPYALDDTLKTTGDATIGFVATLHDIDDINDLRHL